MSRHLPRARATTSCEVLFLCLVQVRVPRIHIEPDGYDLVGGVHVKVRSPGRGRLPSCTDRGPPKRNCLKPPVEFSAVRLGRGRPQRSWKTFSGGSQARVD
jgi:hypothetical protein